MTEHCVASRAAPLLHIFYLLFLPFPSLSFPFLLSVLGTSPFLIHYFATSATLNWAQFGRFPQPPGKCRSLFNIPGSAAREPVTAGDNALVLRQQSDSLLPPRQLTYIFNEGAGDYAGRKMPEAVAG